MQHMDIFVLLHYNTGACISIIHQSENESWDCKATVLTTEPPDKCIFFILYIDLFFFESVKFSIEACFSQAVAGAALLKISCIGQPWIISQKERKK